MKRIGLSLLVVLSLPTWASAAELIHERNEVDRTVTFHARVKDRAYSPLTNEDYMEVFCLPDRHASLEWHVGGRWSGMVVTSDDKVSYRFDDEQPQRTTFGAIADGEGFKMFLGGMLSHKHLHIILSDLLNSSDTFDLSGYSSIAGPNSPLGKQCASEMFGPANASQPLPVIAERPPRWIPITDQPPYPPLSLRLREQGVTELEARVTTDGEISSINVIKSSGYPRLDQAAVDFAKGHWQFVSAARNGQPVEGTFRHEIVWSLP